MPSYELLAILGGTLFLGLLAYQRLWSRIYRRRARLEGLATFSGRVRSIAEGRISVETERGGGPEQVEVTTEEAELLAWPAPGAWRITRDLQAGDPISVAGIELPAGVALAGIEPPAAAGARLEAIRIVRGRWPELPWFGLPVAFGAALLGLLLSQLIREPVPVARVIPTPSASATAGYAHAGSEVRAILEATRRIETVHDWAMLDDRDLASGSPAETGRDEPGTRAETLFDYLESRPRLASTKRRYLYLQPIGALEGRRREILEHTGDFLARYFCLPVKVAEEIPRSRIAWHARRVHPDWGIPQLLSTWILHSLLRARRPDDAAGYLAMTSVDLWPGPGWHSINGQASPVARVGVLSTYRNGDLSGSASFRLHLLRTLKVAAHETGHMFSIRHCPRRGCIMSSRNDRAEADRRLLALCPDCLAKLLAATACDPTARDRALLAFFVRHGIDGEAALYRRLLTASDAR
jgi:archaemetzincin